MDEAILDVEALSKKLDKFESNFKKCSRANRTKGYLKGRLTGLKDLWKSICEGDDKVESLKTDVNANDPYFEDDQFGDLEEKYYLLQGEIEEQLDAFNPQPQVNVNQNANANQNNQNGHQQNDQSNVKLPKISLPSFEGSYLTWLSFKNRFTNLIHNNKSLSNCEKLEYLKSCVTEDAEKAIQRFEITDQNYKAAWDRLNEKYDNKRILQDTQIETIIDRKEIKIESSKELRELLDVVQEALEALKNMQVDTTSWDPFMVVLVTRKLPFKTREEWEKELDPKDVPSFKQLMDFLEKRFRTVESLELVGGQISEPGNENQTAYEIRKFSQSSNQRANCLACNNTFHSLMKCETFLNMTLGNRSAFVNAKRICRNCLAIGHLINECKSNKRCFKCGSSHHTLLHKEDFSQTQSQEPSYAGQFNRNQSNPNYNTNSRNQRQAFVTNYQPNERSQVHQNQSYPNQSNCELNPNANPYTSNQNNDQNGATQSRKVFTTSIHKSPQSQINPMYTDESNKETLFPTAMVTVKDNDGKIWYLRALLDQCSEDVFIKESTARKLKLNQMSIPEVDVSGLNDVVTAQINKTTNFIMVIDNEEVEINASVVDKLIDMLPTTALKLPENLFKNLRLADPTFAKPEKIDIMLGSKMYAHLLLDGVIKEKGYLAQNTKLGWIISGQSDEVKQPKKKTFCGFTCIEPKKNYNSWSTKSKKYFAPQRNSNPVYLSNRNEPVMLYSHVSKRSEVNCRETSSKSQKFNEGTNSELSEEVIVKADIHQVPKNFPTLESHLSMDAEIVSQKPSSILDKSSEIDVINHKNSSAPRLSLIDVNVNRLRKSDQISKIVNNFEQRWKSSFGLAKTSMPIRPMNEMSIFAMKSPKTD